MKVDWERFWEKVDVRGPDECWPWTATKNNDGYGRFRLDGRLVQAHRLACEFARGEAGVETCHTCSNPSCCNPNHLYAGTHSSNMFDRGCKGHSRKLTAEQVWAIRAACTAGDKHKDVAAKFGVHVGTISGIVRGITRKEILGLKTTPSRGIKPISLELYREIKCLHLARYNSAQEFLAARRLGESYASIGRRLGFHPEVVRLVCDGRRWKHLTGL